MPNIFPLAYLSCLRWINQRPFCWNSVHKNPSKIAVNTFATYEPATQLFKSICRYESIGDIGIEEVETEDFWMYLYRFHEMDELLREVGFTDIKKYQDYALTPATDENAHILVYECTR